MQSPYLMLKSRNGLVAAVVSQSQILMIPTPSPADTEKTGFGSSSSSHHDRITTDGMGS
jgi:hypothetical protein